MSGVVTVAGYVAPSFLHDSPRATIEEQYAKSLLKLSKSTLGDQEQGWAETGVYVAPSLITETSKCMRIH